MSGKQSRSTACDAEEIASGRERMEARPTVTLSVGTIDLLNGSQCWNVEIRSGNQVMRFACRSASDAMNMVVEMHRLLWEYTKEISSIEERQG